MKGPTFPRHLPARVLPQAPTHGRKRPPTGDHGRLATDGPPYNKKARILPGKKPPEVAAGGIPGGSAEAAMKWEKGKVEKERPKSKKEAGLHAKVWFVLFLFLDIVLFFHELGYYAVEHS